MNTKKAILVVSFGTSYDETRKKTIDVIESDIQNAFPDYKLYRAWTSQMIIRKILKRDGIKIPTVKEAMKQMAADGICDVIIQPTHVINGIENDIMIQDALSFNDQFNSIRFGAPLLTTTTDQQVVVKAVARHFDQLTADEALILMGHGTSHYVNSVYAALDYMFKNLGYTNIYMGTVEAYPDLDDFLPQLLREKPATIHLAPFMIVAGDHAANDLAGDEEDSWKSRLINKGFNVNCILKGLGEYPEIRELFIQHIKDCM